MSPIWCVYEDEKVQLIVTVDDIIEYGQKDQDKNHEESAYQMT